MIEKMINELLLTTKRTEKISILKKYFADDPEIPKLIARCYNPFEKFYIANIKPNIAGNNNIDNNYKHLNTLLTQLSKREITGNFAREILIRYLNTLTKSSQNVVINILNKDLKCGIGPESINAAYPNLIEQFSIQLANKYKQDKKYNIDYFWGSIKYDGIRCIYQNSIPGVILTREGNEIEGFDNITAELETLVERFKDTNYFTNSNYFIDGELFSDDIGFNEIQGIVLSNKNIDIKKKKQIYLKLFAVGPVNNTETMINIFNDNSIFKGLNKVVPITYFKVNNNYDEIMKKTRDFVEEGYEGLMLRHPIIPYDWKRSDNLLKSKILNETEAELTIIKCNPGKPNTKYQNMLGSFTCSGNVTNPIFTDGKVKLGTFEVTCDVGSGFSDEEREEIWQDPDYYIGKEIIINYQCMSQNSADNKYSLRFGIKKKGFKLDRHKEF